MSPPKSSLPPSNVCLASRAGCADIVAFASALSTIFGSRPRALAFLIRSAPEYIQWRSTREWCPLCRTYVPILRSTDPGLVTYAPHPSSHRPTGTCSTSGHATRWLGDADPDLQHLSRARLLSLITPDLGVSAHVQP